MNRCLKVLNKYLLTIKYEFFLIFFLSILFSLIELYSPYLLKNIVDNGFQEKDFRYILSVSAKLVMLYVVSSALNATISAIFSRVSIKVITNIKQDIYVNMLRYPISFFDKNKTGYIISRIDEIDALNSLFSPMLMKFVISIFVFIGAFITMFFIKWQLLLFAMIMLPIVYFITKSTSKKIRRSSKELNETAAQTKGDIHESLSSIADIKNFNLEKKKEKDYSSYVQKLSRELLKRNIITVFGNESVSLFLALIKSIFIVIIGYYIVDGSLTVGAYFSLMAYISNLFSPIQMLSSINLSVQPALAVLSRLNFFNDTQKEIEFDGEIIIDKISSVRVENLSFSYPEEDTKVLENLNVSISNCENLYIFGPNGSGKTTFIKLLLGLYHNYEGNIFFNEKNMREINVSDLRRKIGIVSQKINLFSGNILDNICLWDAKISESEIRNKLQKYGLEHILDDSHYMNLEVNESGKNLSGGQLQEIALARAILKDSSVYIFDEPTSNFDHCNKLKFIEVLKRLEEKICIVITHDEYLITHVCNDGKVLDFSSSYNAQHAGA